MVQITKEGAIVPQGPRTGYTTLRHGPWKKIIPSINIFGTILRRARRLRQASGTSLEVIGAGLRRFKQASF